MTDKLIALVQYFTLFISLHLQNLGLSLSQGPIGWLSMVEAKSPSVLQFLRAYIPLLDEKVYTLHSFLCEHLCTLCMSSLLRSLLCATLTLHCNTLLCSLHSSMYVPTQLVLYSHALTLPETIHHLSLQFYLHLRYFNLYLFARFCLPNLPVHNTLLPHLAHRI